MRPAILKFILISAFAFSFMGAQAQDKKEESDSLKRRAIQKPTGVRIGTDLIAIGKTVFDSPLSGWELNADVDFDRYYLALEYGSWARKDSVANDGRYFRIGVDVNFLLNDPDKNMFFLGFRYGRSTFDEQLNYQTTLADFGIIQKEISNQNATAGWGELTTGLRVKIWKYLWMGYTARMKFSPNVKGNQELETYDIPGYGKTSKAVYWGFNYQVFWRIPLKKNQ